MAARHVLENLTVDWEKLSGPIRDATLLAPAEGAEPRGSAPGLDAFQTDDLRSVPRLLALHRDAVARGLVDRSKHGLVAFLSTAAYALRVGRTPPGLFVHLLRAGRFPATIEDEDRAMGALKKHRAACESSRRWLKQSSRYDLQPTSRTPPSPGLSRDAALLEAARAELGRRGLSGRLFAAQRAHSGFTRERYSAALAELEQAAEFTPPREPNAVRK